MADVRSHGNFLFGTADADFIQGYNVFGSPGDFGAAQILSGFDSATYTDYGLIPFTLSVNGYTETPNQIDDKNDSILGGFGSDILLGGGGDDILIGGAASFFGNDDTLYGGWGNDRLIGGNGAETADGGIDHLKGGPGNDILNGMDGGDIIEGDGDDPALFANGLDVAIYSKPRDSYEISAGYDTILKRPVWYVRDKTTFETDKVSGVEYLYFGRQTSPSSEEIGLKINQLKENPNSNNDLLKLTYLYLDFDNPSPVLSYVDHVDLASGAIRRSVVSIEGPNQLSRLAGVGNTLERDTIVAAVQKIFDNSGLDLVVADGNTASGEDGHRIRFSPQTLDNTLLGVAYEGVDRFNKDPDNTAAVFMNSSNINNNPLVLYDTIAHEAAHTFGIRHANPATPKNVVEDYDFGANPVFIKTPEKAVEFINNSEVYSGFTQNSVFHIRKYLLNDSVLELIDDGVSPGTWDEGSYLIATYSLSFPDISTSLSNLSIIYTDKLELAGGGGDEDLGLARVLSQNVQPGDTIIFDVIEGRTFRLVASTSDGTLQDVTLNFGSNEVPQADVLAKDALSLTAEIVSRQPSGLLSTKIGMASISTVVTREVNADENGPTSNTPPIAVNDTATAISGQPLVIAAATLLANDIDLDGNTITITDVNGATNGTVAFDVSNNTATFTPNAGYIGPASFEYSVSDGKGGTSQATVAIVVTGAPATNQPPVGVNDSYSTDEDATLTIPASTGTLANDTDADGDPLTATVMSGPSHGSLTLMANGSFTYTPTPNYNGADSFTYKASDGTTDSVAATVNLTVGAVNDAPIAGDDVASTSAATAVTINVAANDSDPDGTIASYALGTAPANGSALLNPDNTFTYTPKAGFTGLDSFTYTVTDNAGATDTAAVQVTVSPDSEPTQNTLTIQVASDSYAGDAQFIVLVDDLQVGDVQTATTPFSSGSGQFHAVTLQGDFGPDPQTVTVRFINDAYGGSSSTDRNLYVDKLVFNGQTYQGEQAFNPTGLNTDQPEEAAALYFQDAPLVFKLENTLTLSVAGDSFNGDAQFIVLVDGQQIGGVQTATTAFSAGSGQFQDISITGQFTLNPGEVEVRFVNDIYGGSSSTDRNLYVNKLTLGNGRVFEGEAANNVTGEGTSQPTDAAALYFDQAGLIFHTQGLLVA